jgi:hypothetical protein
MLLATRWSHHAGKRHPATANPPHVAVRDRQDVQDAFPVVPSRRRPNLRSTGLSRIWSIELRVDRSRALSQHAKVCDWCPAGLVPRCFHPADPYEHGRAELAEVD